MFMHIHLSQAPGAPNEANVFRPQMLNRFPHVKEFFIMIIAG